MFTLLLFYVKMAEIHVKITSPRRVMFNKIVNINHIVTKFAPLVLYTFAIMYANVWKKLTTFAEVTLKY